MCGVCDSFISVRPPSFAVIDPYQMHRFASVMLGYARDRVRARNSYSIDLLVTVTVTFAVTVRGEVRVRYVRFFREPRSARFVARVGVGARARVRVRVGVRLSRNNASRAL